VFNSTERKGRSKKKVGFAINKILIENDFQEKDV